MKKLAMFLVVLLAASTVLFAAGNKQATDSNDVRLTMLIAWNGGYMTPADQYNNPVAKAIREKTGVTVEFEGIMMSETEKLNLMFASGDMPDIVNAPFWGGNGGETAVIKKAAAEGRLLPIEDYLKSGKYPNIERALKVGVISQKYLEIDLSDPSFNGHTYIIPTQTPGSAVNITNWAYGVFVRGDVPKALGIDPTSIKTSAQLYDFMKKAQAYGFKDVNGNDTIVATTFQNGWDYGQYAANFGTQKLTPYVKNSDGSLTHDMLTPNWIEQNLFLWKLVNEGILDKECFKTSATLAYQKVGNGSALFFSAQYVAGIDATKQTGLYNSNPEMRYVPVGPLNDRDGKPLVQMESMGRTGSPAIFFPSTCKDIEAALRYIDYLNSPEGVTLTTYGIEGQTFVRNAAGQPRLIPDYLNRKKAGDATWVDAFREVGAGYIGGSPGGSFTQFATQNIEWFGESAVGEADAAVPELEAYKKLRPVQQYSGYPLSAFESEFPQLARVSALGDQAKDYCERAYFANTEAEARQILESYQTYLRTQDGGVFLQFLDFMAGKAKARPDIAF
ncbi:ABC transporter [Spirochaetia bacterium]|nr:ABC transporter [Spirochaetia bacterium]